VLATRFEKTAIINRSIRATGKNNDVEGSQVIDADDLKADVIDCG
jgi:hypothetical protein